MKRSSTLMAISLLMATTAGIASGQQVFGYYTNWATYGRHYQPTDLPVSDLTTALYAFGQVGNCAPPYATDAQPLACSANGQNTGVQDFQLHSTDPYSDFNVIPTDYANAKSNGLGNMAKVINAMHSKKKPALLSIGGYTLTVGLTQAMSNPQHRDTFIKSVTHFLNQVKADNRLDGFDGVDIDWEPNDNQWSFLNDSQLAYQRLSDYVAFLKGLRTELSTQYAKYSWLTVALPASPAVIQQADKIYPGFWRQVAATVDYMDIMSYDYHGAFDNPKITNFNAPLQYDPQQPQTVVGRETFNLQSTVAAYLAAGVPSQKLIAGLPAYGRALAGVANRSPSATQPLPGLYQEFAGPYQGQWDNDGIYDYRYIVSTLLKHGFNAYPVPAAGETAAYNTIEKAWISFDSVTDVKQKVSFARQQQLGGVMFWDLSGDFHPNEQEYNSLSLIHAAAQGN